MEEQLHTYEMERQQREGDETSQTDEYGHTEPVTHNKAYSHTAPDAPCETNNKDNEEVISQPPPRLAEEHAKNA